MPANFDLQTTGLRLRRALPSDPVKFSVEILDTWNMTTTRVPGEFAAGAKPGFAAGDQEGLNVPLPGRPYLAVRIKQVKE